MKHRIKQLDKEREIYGKSYSAELTRSNHYKQQRDRLAEAMLQMWPFIEEDDYPNCNTPAFNAAILKYKQALQSLTTNAEVSHGDLELQPDTHSTHNQP
jgi:hypothetical protein